MAGNGLEIERKYLLSGVPPEAELEALGASAKGIEQVYLRTTDGWVRRVRRVVADGRARYILTLKQDVEGITRREIESDLAPDEYRRLRGEADPDRRAILKVRHVIPYRRWTLELDVFGQPPGLVLLEVELDDAADVPELPPSIAALVVREVSTDPAYANYNLARRPGLPTADEEDDDELQALAPAEAERARRRDHDASAAERAGMRTGLAKSFKQVLDAQARRARAAEDPGSRPRSKVGRPAPKRRDDRD